MKEKQRKPTQYVKDYGYRDVAKEIGKEYGKSLLSAFCGAVASFIIHKYTNK